MLADFMGDGPLVALFGRLRSEIDLLLAAGALRPAALGLVLIETDHHAEVPLSQSDSIHRRPSHAGRVQQLLDSAVHDVGDFFAGELLDSHGEPRDGKRTIYLYICAREAFQDA